MKKQIGFAVAAMLFLCSICGCTGTGGASAEDDYAKIQQVQDACEKVANSSVVRSGGRSQGVWYIFELEFIHQGTDPIHEKLEEELGEDFETSLSNGDSLFVGFLPVYEGSYRIYAGNPNNEENMIYPDWNYTKVPEQN